MKWYYLEPVISLPERFCGRVMDTLRNGSCGELNDPKLDVSIRT